MPNVTTIKVSRGLRERISRGAAERGMTASAWLTKLVDNDERQRRLAAVGKAYAAHGVATDEYLAETAEWDTTLNDGLGGD